MTGTRGTLTRTTALLVGCALGVALVLAGRMPEGRAPIGVDLSLSARTSPKLGVEPAGSELLRGPRLQPGASPVRGKLSVSNYATAPVVATVRLTGANADLDGLVEAAVSADNKTVFKGKLRELRSWSAARFRLAPKQRRELTVRAWLPRSVHHDFEGRSAELELEWRAAKANG
jgi:hypothetical protein